MKRVLIANRGEIALRVQRACEELGLETVAVYSEADQGSRHVQLSTMSLHIGPAPAKQSYLDKARIIKAAKATGADAMHPGYGFLSEDDEFADLCEASRLIFVGPTGDSIRRMGDKISAKNLAQELGVPLVPGGNIAADADLDAMAPDLSYPILLKAAAGGGGRGMRVVRQAAEFKPSVRQARSEALEAFGDGTVYWESFIENARHIEVQVLSDTHGNHIQLGERDCTLQRRHQKLLEETPSPTLSAELRQALYESSVRIISGLGYRGAGTIEFLFDVDRQSIHFIEMNTRIQVEHPVTEEVNRVDLVREQLRIASGLPISEHVLKARPYGCSLECRINAEDPARGFVPTPGRITRLVLPGGPGVRVDTHCQEGTLVSPFYDSMIAKLIVWDVDRPSALRRMHRALSEFVIEGVSTTIPFHLKVLDSQAFQNSTHNTRWIETTALKEFGL